MTLGRDPAVLTWQAALAPRPRSEPIGHHWWREWVTEAYRAARDAWEANRESGLSMAPGVAGTAHALAGNHQLSDVEYAQAFPPPRLGDFMRHLSSGKWDPYEQGGAA